MHLHVCNDHDLCVPLKIHLTQIITCFDVANESLSNNYPVLVPAKPVVESIRSCRLSVADFDTLEVIGRGAFGEVKVHVCTCMHVD